MSEPMLVGLAFVATLVGLAWLALAMESHWEQVRGPEPLHRRTAIVHRVLGGAALASAFALCLAADHASMAVLVWVMSLTAAGVVVAMTFSFRPRLFALLVVPV